MGADVTDVLTSPNGATKLNEAIAQADAEADGLHFIDAADVRQEPQEPLLLRWGQRVPEKALTLLLGREDRGKTTLACQLAADVSVGGLGNPPRTVLFLSHEDAASIIASRLQAADADMSRVKILSHVQLDGKRTGFRLPRDEKLLEAAVKNFTPALIVLGGSLMSHVEAGRDYKGQTDMRAVMEPLHDIAERFGPAVVAVVHPNKGRTADPGHSVTGSAAVIESARSALLLEVEGEDESALVLAHFKANNSAKEESLTFRRESITLPNGIKTVRLKKTGTSKLSAVELISQQLRRTSGEGRISKRDQAKNLLEVLLGDHEPHLVSEVRPALEAAGYGKGTIDRARTDLGLVSTHDHQVPPRHFWTLPKPFERPKDGATGATGRNGALEPNLASDAVQSPQNQMVGATGVRRRPGGPVQPAVNGRNP